MCTCGHAIGYHHDPHELPAKCRRCACNRYEVAIGLGQWPLTGDAFVKYFGVTEEQARAA